MRTIWGLGLRQAKAAKERAARERVEAGPGNAAALAPPDGARRVSRVSDIISALILVGSGAGLPGLVVAILRPGTATASLEVPGRHAPRRTAWSLGAAANGTNANAVTFGPGVVTTGGDQAAVYNNTNGTIDATYETGIFLPTFNRFNHHSFERLFPILAKEIQSLGPIG